MSSVFPDSEEKAALRLRFRTLRSALPLPRRNALDAEICHLFLNSEVYRSAGTLLLYASLPEEIDLFRILQEARADGKETAYPLCDPKTGTLTFHMIESVSQLIPGFFGLREPAPDTPVFSSDRIASGQAVCLVPGIVFDRRGYRIGFGKGYYDRFLPDFPGITVGLAYDCCVVPSLPREPFDRPVSLLVTEKGVLTAHEC